MQPEECNIVYSRLACPVAVHLRPRLFLSSLSTTPCLLHPLVRILSVLTLYFGARIPSRFTIYHRRATTNDRTTRLNHDIHRTPSNPPPPKPNTKLSLCRIPVKRAYTAYNEQNRPQTHLLLLPNPAPRILRHHTINTNIAHAITRTTFDLNKHPLHLLPLQNHPNLRAPLPINPHQPAKNTLLSIPNRAQQ